MALLADALQRDLAPAAGGGAEVDHLGAALEDAMLVVDLDQLVSRARAETVSLGAHDVRIVELAFEPGPLGRRLLLVLDADLQFTLAAAAADLLGHGVASPASPQTPSS